jgi:hypothetical protein
MSLSLLTGIEAVFEWRFAEGEVTQPIVVGAAGPLVFLQCSEVHPGSECELVTVF